MPLLSWWIGCNNSGKKQQIYHLLFLQDLVFKYCNEWQKQVAPFFSQFSYAFKLSYAFKGFSFILSYLRKIVY